MSALVDWAGAALVLAGTVSITLGTVGLLRFPDALSRLHALTKADNVGLGCCAVGLALIGREPITGFTMLTIWIGVMFSGATAAHLVARRQLERSDRP
jgi:multicomponent Na+:H+ antiporter subunit G